MKPHSLWPGIAAALLCFGCAMSQSRTTDGNIAILKALKNADAEIESIRDAAAKGPPEVDKLRTRAEQGDADAAFILGTFYDTSLSVPKDSTKAVYWFRRAAEKGHAGAQNSLGSLYQAGEGVPRDYVEAIRWYTLAADQGHNTALMNLGYMYDEGLGVPEDNRRAIALYKQAAERLKIGAMLNLGLMFVNGGKDVYIDSVQALMWFDLCRIYAREAKDPELANRATAYVAQIKKEMTPTQIKRGQAMAHEWDAAMERRALEQQQGKAPR